MFLMLVIKKYISKKIWQMALVLLQRKTNQLSEERHISFLPVEARLE
jgi:hypothetical protein